MASTNNNNNFNILLDLHEYRESYEHITALINECSIDDLVADSVLESLIKEFAIEQDEDLIDTRANSDKSFLDLMKSITPFHEIVHSFVQYYKNIGEENDGSLLIEALEYIASLFSNMSGLDKSSDIDRGIKLLMLLLPSLSDSIIIRFDLDSETPFENSIYHCLVKCLVYHRWDLVNYMLTKFEISPVGLYQAIASLTSNEFDATFSPLNLKNKFPQIVDPLFYKNILLEYVGRYFLGDSLTYEIILKTIHSDLIPQFDPYEIVKISKCLNSIDRMGFILKYGNVMTNFDEAESESESDLFISESENSSSDSEDSSYDSEDSTSDDDDYNY